MRNLKTTIFGLVIVVAFLASALAALPVHASPSVENTIARGTVVSYTIESAHPYANNYDYTWTITQAGATEMRVFFSQYQVQTTKDKIYVMDGNGVVKETLSSSTTITNYWSVWIQDDVVKIRLKTDRKTTYYGFKITQYEYNTGSSGGSELTSGVPVTGSLSATGDTNMWTILVGANCANMYSVLTCGTVDFDLYGKLGAAPTLSSYDWRGYTSGGEEVSYDFPAAGTWYIMVQSYSGSGSYELTVTLTTGGSTEITWGTGGKYAVIVGISDYKAINDLSFCDEDATDFYNYLTALGYECKVLGDGHITDYPRHDAKASEYQYKRFLNSMLAHAQAGDEVAFITSGHGSGDGRGSSYLCAWDCNSGESGEDGNFYDTEIAAIFNAGLKTGVNTFILIDHCYSGGLGPEMMAITLKAQVYMTTTCTANGYGYDDSAHNNGMWTYWFLEAGLIGHFGSNPSTTMENAFDWASAQYPYQSPSGDAPMEFDGNTGASYIL